MLNLLSVVPFRQNGTDQSVLLSQNLPGLSRAQRDKASGLQAAPLAHHGSRDRDQPLHLGFAHVLDKPRLPDAVRNGGSQGREGCVPRLTGLPHMLCRRGQVAHGGQLKRDLLDPRMGYLAAPRQEGPPLADGDPPASSLHPIRPGHVPRPWPHVGDDEVQVSLERSLHSLLRRAVRRHAQHRPHDHASTHPFVG